MRLIRDFILINILSIFLLIYYVGFLKKTIHIENKPARIQHQPKFSINAKTTNLKINEESYQNNKLRNPEWEQINKYTFFRRSSGYYFVDTLLLRIFLIVKSTSVLNNFTAELRIENSNDEFITKLNLVNSSLRNHDGARHYALFSLNFEQFNLSKEIEMSPEDIQTLKLKIIIIDSKNYLKTKYPIDIKMRHSFSKNKSGSIICSTCFFYYENKKLKHDGPYFFKLFQWWFELNKQIGHKKITIYNTSIPNRKDFNDLFYEYRGYVEIIDLQYLPNFFMPNESSYHDEEHDYLRSFINMTWGKYVVFQILVFNDCYLNNKHLYDFISVVDPDETILPRMNTKIQRHTEYQKLITDLNLLKINDKNSLNKLLDLESSCTPNDKPRNDLVVYLNQLKHEFNFKKDVNFDFDMVYYLSFQSIELIFDKIESFLNDEKNLEKKFPFKIEIKDTFYRNYTYSFLFSNNSDVKYIENLIKIYKILIKDFIIKNNETLIKYSYEYSRYFYLGGSLTTHRCGKTIHNTNVSLQMTVHYSDGHGSKTIRYNHGASSHFRVEYNFKDNRTISIQDLILDLNYIYCYYRHVLKRLTSLDIISN